MTSDIQSFRDLLARWAIWVYKGNKGALGYARSSYSEMIGSGAYGNDAADSIDTDVLSWDSFWRSGKIADQLQQPIVVHYLLPGKVKDKTRSTSAYYERKIATEYALMSMWQAERK